MGRKEQKWSKWDVKEAKKNRKKKIKRKLCVLAHACNLSTWKFEVSLDSTVGPSLNKMLTKPRGDFRK